MALVKYNNNSISAITTAGTLSASQVLIKEQTASASATISFVNGSGGVVLDSTYPIYKFEFINIHPSTNHTDFKFNMSTDGGSNYNVTKTTTFFVAYHSENDVATALQYSTGSDLAQSTSDQTIAYYVSNDNDGSASGELYLFNPSSTFVKHFLARANGMYKDTADGNSPYTHDFYSAGYGNTISSIDAVRFQMSSGNIDTGTIKLYGIRDS